MKVRCVNASPMKGDVKGQPVLVEGEIYHVTKVVEGIAPDGFQESCVVLKEFSEPVWSEEYEMWAQIAWQMERFVFEN
jgi:hypothetical protein